jgi:fatty acid desaturase
MSNDRIAWYRTKIDPGQFRELTRRSNARGLAQCLLHLGLACATGYASYYAWHHWHWSVFLLILLVLHGTVMAFLGVTAACHELSHGTPFKSRALARFFYNLFSFLTWNNPAWFKVSHMEHHKYTLYDEQDQEVILPAFFGWKDFLKAFVLAPAFWWQPPRRHVIHSMGKLANPWDERIFGEGKAQERRAMHRWARILVYGHLALAAVCIWTGEWILIPIALFPFYGGAISQLYGGAQHMGLQSNVPDFRRSCRTMLLSPLEAFLYWQMNYHAEHHMFPGVPFFNGRKLHALLAADGAPAPNRNVINAWREIAMIQKQQHATPGVAFDVFSRGGTPVYVPQRGIDTAQQKETNHA